MMALDLYLYLGLGVATVISLLVSLSSHRHVRMIRNATILFTYVLFIALFFVEPWWRVLAVWSLVGLFTGLICFMVDCMWTRRGRTRQVELPYPTNWWLIPMGLLGWPDMLPQALEMALFDHRLFRPLPTSNQSC